MSKPVDSATPVAALPYETTARAAGAVTIGFIGLKLLSIYLILQVVHLSSILWAFLDTGQRTVTAKEMTVRVLAWGLPTVLEVAAGVVLFIKARVWAEKLFARHGDHLEPVTADNASVLIISGIGLWVTVESLPRLCFDLANLLSSRWQLNTFFGGSQSLWGWQAEGIVRSAVALGLGICLLLFAPRLAKLFNRRLRPVK